MSASVQRETWQQARLAHASLRTPTVRTVYRCLQDFTNHMDAANALTHGFEHSRLRTHVLRASINFTRCDGLMQSTSLASRRGTCGLVRRDSPPSDPPFKPDGVADVRISLSEVVSQLERRKRVAIKRTRATSSLARCQRLNHATQAAAARLVVPRKWMLNNGTVAMQVPDRCLQEDVFAEEFAGEIR